jgi:hypothetical protein
MNPTLEKFKLMEQLNIASVFLYTYPELEAHLGEIAVAGILERLCREWLEKQTVFVYCFDSPHEGEVDRYTFKFLDYSYDPVYPCLSSHIETYSSFDAAQIAALKHCLGNKEINT